MAGKRIVLTTWGSFGDLHPYMALAIELKQRGNSPVVATSEIYREKVENEGLEFFPLRPDLPPPDSELAAEMIRRVSDTIRGPAYLFQKLLMPNLRDAYDDTLTAVAGADLLVSHQVPVTGRMVAEKTGIKWISAVLFPLAFASAHDPPTPPQFPALREIALIHPAIASMMLKVGKWTMSFLVEPMQELRKDLGLARIDNPIFEGQHSPMRVLALFSPEFAAMQPDFPPNTLITGFPFFDRNDVRSPLPPEVEDFLNEGEPPILFTLGSALVWMDSDFYKIAVEAASELGKRALLLTGDQRNLPERLPAGIACFDYVPHYRVMPRSSCIVHPGGIGTTGQALRAGRPILVVPHGQDHPDNSRRCVDLGVARSLPVARLTTSRLVTELTALLTEPSYARRAAELGQKVGAENGTKTACDEIERILDL